MAYKLAVLEILRNLFVLAYITCPRYPYIAIESTESTITMGRIVLHYPSHAISKYLVGC